MLKAISKALKKPFIVFILIFTIGILYFKNSVKNVESSNYKEKKIETKKYKSIYIGKIEKKYPEVYRKKEEYRQLILKSIVSHTEEMVNKNTKVSNYFDKNGKIVYKITEDLTSFKKTTQGARGSSGKKIELFTPDEEGFIYDEKGMLIKKIKALGGLPYSVTVVNEENKRNFLRTGNGIITCKEIIYDGLLKKKEVEEDINDHPYFQYYKKIERFYENDILYKEKEFEDQELDDSFIMYTTEKKYNEKGELIYKTVERKDKTNDYKSFTEMDFAKDEIVTKYYKGKDVFATVTENLVGPVETIEEIEMDRGKEIKKTYKNKVKAIVKRQKVGKPVKIVDVIEYVPKEIREKNNEKYHGWAIDNIRYIFNDKGEIIYKIFGIKASISTYLYDNLQSDLNNMKDGLYHESFFQINYDTSEYQAFLFNIYKIQKYDFTNNKIIDMRLLDSNEKIFDEEINITSLKINENNLEKISEKEIDKNEIKTLEELLNGYNY